MNNIESKQVEAEIVTEDVPIDAKAVEVKRNVGSIGKPLTPEQMIREEENKIKSYEEKIDKAMERVKEYKYNIKKAKERIKLYQKAIEIQ
jgi:peptidoglycan hydrolase CwlO-like protein